jgi:hypothetical protein
MAHESDGASDLDRRGFIQLSVAAARLAGACGTALAKPCQTPGDIARQPNPTFANALNTTDINDESRLGATRAFAAKTRRLTTT